MAKAIGADKEGDRFKEINMTKVQGWILIAIIVAGGGYYLWTQSKQQSVDSELQACLASCDKNFTDYTAPDYTQAYEGCRASCQDAAQN